MQNDMALPRKIPTTAYLRRLAADLTMTSSELDLAIPLYKQCREMRMTKMEKPRGGNHDDSGLQQ